ncbi:uncharacterized protein MONOS_4777 [Monocercomonoides exilis]|uniref:uncharacterized protein n=1 Tax=Monocercomonoides exilis TaxID=2049356 RepID=UPI00355995EF|nr:hypothetical protein MONOS_4777 [Monocercomonoides exilis]|eukprot:MONOS_4777.1-p1 / transcript=MONOS_4777.1 / gene=MONOS_4777 / organism=Monocercomonoides_exilis_PA203 / gene_product=unspecified product / transcript_product=unspecified product / location=Mono_scaffold00131:110091-112443(+) / protein_length=753 / sequence_SO=supercontig / SO=protein_coding / is_pseudo=false
MTQNYSIEDCENCVMPESHFNVEFSKERTQLSDGENATKKSQKLLMNQTSVPSKRTVSFKQQTTIKRHIPSITIPAGNPEFGSLSQPQTPNSRSQSNSPAQTPTKSFSTTFSSPSTPRSYSSTTNSSQRTPTSGRRTLTKQKSTPTLIQPPFKTPHFVQPGKQVFLDGWDLPLPDPHPLSPSHSTSICFTPPVSPGSPNPSNASSTKPIPTLKEELKTLKSEVDIQKKAMKDLEEKLSEYKEKISQTEEQLRTEKEKTSMMVDKKESEWKSALEKEVTKAQIELQRKDDECEAKIRELNEANKVLKCELDQARQKYEEQEVKQRLLENEWGEEVDRQKEIISCLENKICVLEKSLSVMKEQMDELRKIAKDNENEIKEKEIEIETLKNTEKKQEKEIEKESNLNTIKNLEIQWVQDKCKMIEQFEYNRIQNEKKIQNEKDILERKYKNELSLKERHWNEEMEKLRKDLCETKGKMQKEIDSTKMAASVVQSWMNSEIEEVKSDQNEKEEQIVCLMKENEELRRKMEEMKEMTEKKMAKEEIFSFERKEEREELKESIKDEIEKELTQSFEKQEEIKMSKMMQTINDIESEKKEIEIRLQTIIDSEREKEEKIKEKEKEIEEIQREVKNSQTVLFSQLADLMSSTNPDTIKQMIIKEAFHRYSMRRELTGKAHSTKIEEIDDWIEAELSVYEHLLHVASMIKSLLNPNINFDEIFEEEIKTNLSNSKLSLIEVLKGMLEKERRELAQLICRPN